MLSTTSTFSIFSILIVSASAMLQNPFKGSTPPNLPVDLSSNLNSGSNLPSNPLLSDPPFLTRLSPQAKRQYDDIVNNDSLTPIQIEQQLAKWAQSNGVVNEWNKYQQEQKTFLENLNTNIKKEIGNLGEVFQKLTQIFKNQNQSVRLQRQDIEQLTKQYPDEVTALFFISQLAIAKSLPSGAAGPSRFSTPSWSHPTRSRPVPTQHWNWPTTRSPFPFQSSSTHSTPTTRRFPPFPPFPTTRSI